MLILLPPSETKRADGELPPVELGSLRFPSLTQSRRRLVDAVRALAEDEEGSIRALKLGPRQGSEVERNRRILTSPTMPALQRYTGVLYEALDFPSLTEEERAFADRHVLVHSALFGLVSALDAIPAYRLSAGSRVPGVGLKDLWVPELTAVLHGVGGLILDLRSESYAALGPAPHREGSVYLRVVTVDGSGRRRALNHFNKKSKGLFVRAMIRSGALLEDVESLCAWAARSGFGLERRDRELDLLVPDPHQSFAVP